MNVCIYPGAFPIEIFLASIGTCAGIYVLGFCQQRGLPTEGIRIIQRIHRDRSTSMVNSNDLEMRFPTMKVLTLNRSGQ
jgi:ribosomal protein S12 methylthiotransferase accessory factor